MLALLPVLVGDVGHDLMEQESWLLYGTEFATLNLVYVYGRCFTVALRCVVTVVQRNDTPQQRPLRWYR